jgi:hypothetical protein
VAGFHITSSFVQADGNESGQELTPQLTAEQKGNSKSARKPPMPPGAEPNPEGEADRLDAAADQAIAACGGDARNR